MPDISEFSDEPGKVWKLTGPNSISSPGGDAPEPDWDVLAAQAEKDHRAANERFHAAKEASEEAAFRQLIFTAASNGVVRMRISPSDQGDWMTVDWAEDKDGEDMLDGPLDNELHDGTADLPDQRNATWTRAAGVTVEENSRHEIHMASIDVIAAAKALLDVEPTWTFVGHWENDRIVVEYVLPGDVQDVREDDGYWEQGLFAASASAPTQDEAMAKVRDEYENN